jgi:hypothetical protein
VTWICHLDLSPRVDLALQTESRASRRRREHREFRPRNGRPSRPLPSEAQGQ